MSFKAVLHWAHEHPVPTYTAVGVGGLILLFLLLKGGGSSASDGGLGAAYYNALGAQNVSSNNLMATQSNNAAAVAVAGINAKTATDTQSQWAAVSSQQSSDSLAATLAATGAGQTVNLAQIGATRDVNLAGIQAGVDTTGINAAVAEHTSDNALNLGHYQADTSLLGTYATVFQNQQNNNAAQGINSAALHFTTAGGQQVALDSATGELFSADFLTSQGFSAGQVQAITGSPPTQH